MQRRELTTDATYKYEPSWMANILPSSVEQNSLSVFCDDCAVKSIMQHEVTFDGSLIITFDEQTHFISHNHLAVTQQEYHNVWSLANMQS